MTVALIVAVDDADLHNVGEAVIAVLADGEIESETRAVLETNEAVGNRE